MQTACQEADRVVVTGSNIAGASESAALPVEVYTADENFKSGNQKNIAKKDDAPACGNAGFRRRSGRG